MPAKEINNQQEVLRQLAEKAIAEKKLGDRRGWPLPKPGEMIKSLGIVKRMILKDLTPKDIENDRWPR
jgi:hypothetical protein